jgi:DNA repair exonuclease SbcCD ATPase subunit
VKITTLQLGHFRRYKDLAISFAPGLTIVRGPNEAGKSTIQRAIELALTRKATSTNADIDALRTWGAADEDRSVVTIDFEDEDEEGNRHTGTLEKNFRGARGSVRLEIDGQSTTDPGRADELIAEMTGIPTEAFFRSTASVRHHEVADLARDEASLHDRLQASISGADRGTSRVKRKLERALRDLTKGGDKFPGRLKVVEEAVSRAQAAVEQGDLALEQLERDRDALSTAREHRAQVESTLAERRTLLEKARQAERLIAEREVSQERFERFRTAVAVSEELDGLRANHPSPNPLPVLRQVVDRLRRLDQQIRELKAELSGEVEVRFDVAPEPAWRPLSRIAIPLVVGGLLLAGAAFVARTFLQVDVLGLGAVPLYLGGIAAGIGLIFAFVGLWLRRSDRIQRELRDVEIARRLRGRSQMEAELRQAEADTKSQLASLELPDLQAAEDILAREEAHIAQIDRLAAQLDGLVGKEPIESLPSLRDAAALDIEQKTHALEALGPIAKEPRARERLEVEVRDEEAALERARDDESNARARVEHNTVDAEQVALEAESLASAREQLASNQRRVRVYEATLRAVEQAERATLRSATRYLERRMVGDLARVSGGRYKRVRVDDKTLDMWVFAPERDDWVEVTSLSQGTLDLVYLAARLGLVRLVTGGRRPPLIFDDPFVTLDEERATRAFELLKELAADFQVIYLTTSERYDARADHVVELPAPTEVDESAEVAPPTAVGQPA